VFGLFSTAFATELEDRGEREELAVYEICTIGKGRWIIFRDLLE
jgi:hypothetical protein